MVCSPFLRGFFFFCGACLLFLFTALQGPALPFNTSSVAFGNTFPCRTATLLSLCDISPHRGITSRGRLSAPTLWTKKEPPKSGSFLFNYTASTSSVPSSAPSSSEGKSISLTIERETMSASSLTAPWLR